MTTTLHCCSRLLGLALLACVSVAAPAAAQNAWWRSDTVRRSLALTPEQVTSIEGIFRRNLPERRARRRALERAEIALQRAIERADEASALPLISEVEDLRRTINVARTRMLLEMMLRLSPDQRRRFAAATRAGSTAAAAR